LWLPSEERYFNIGIALLVLILLALGFEILKLPTRISPNLPAALQLAGLTVLAILNLIIIWLAAGRDDFVRFSFGFPRVLVTALILMAACTLAFLIREWVAGSVIIDRSQPVSCSSVIGVCLGGQFVALLIFAAFFVKKTDTKAREFKKQLRASRTFVKCWASGQIDSVARLKEVYARAEASMKELSKTATALHQSVASQESEYAERMGRIAQSVASRIESGPEAALTGQKFELDDDQAAEIDAFLGTRRWRATRGR
jgi:hypothetical protein